MLSFCFEPAFFDCCISDFVAVIFCGLVAATTRSERTAHGLNGASSVAGFLCSRAFLRACRSGRLRETLAGSAKWVPCRALNAAAAFVCRSMPLRLPAWGGSTILSERASRGRDSRKIAEAGRRSRDAQEGWRWDRWRQGSHGSEGRMRSYVSEAHMVENGKGEGQRNGWVAELGEGSWQAGLGAEDQARRVCARGPSR